MLNVAVLMGRLVADPELRQTPNGISACTFRIAVDRSYVRSGEERKADFIDIVAWRQTAEFVCKYFKKGSLIAVDGSIQTRNYEDRQGNKRTAFEVVASNVNFTGERSASSGQGGYAAPAPAAPRPTYTQQSPDVYVQQEPEVSKQTRLQPQGYITPSVGAVPGSDGVIAGADDIPF